MGSHALFSPSGAHRWMRCPGSLALERKEVERSSSYAEEGVRAHEFAAEVLTAGEFKQSIFCKYPEEMHPFISEYVTTILEYKADGTLLIEQKVDFSRYLNTSSEDAYGTADAIVILEDEIQVHDLKYGMGVKVDAEENEQLMLYGLGALELCALLGDFKRVRFVIHQPRLNHLSEWSCTVEELLAFGERAAAAARNARGWMDEDTKDIRLAVQPGEKQCRFCRAKSKCPALADMVELETNISFEDLTQESIPLPGKETYYPHRQTLGRFLRKLPLIEMWVKAVKEDSMTLAMAGEEIDGFKLVEGRKGARAWKSDGEVEAVMRAMRLKQDEMYSMKLVTPARAEEVFKDQPRRWKKLSEFIVQKEGNPSLVANDDPRPAITIEPCKFENLEA